MSRQAQLEEEPKDTALGTCDPVPRLLLSSPRGPNPMGAAAHPASAHGHHVAPFHEDSHDWLALPPVHPSCACQTGLQPSTVMFDERTAVPSSSPAPVTSNRGLHAQVSKLGGHERPLYALGYRISIFATLHVSNSFLRILNSIGNVFKDPPLRPYELMLAGR